MKILLLASAALGLAATPAFAQGKSHGNHRASMAHSSHMTSAHMGSTHMAMNGQHGRSTLSTRLDGNRNGILDRRERGYRDRNRDGRDDRFQNRYGANSCPPGLAKKDNGCMPPGQHARLFRQGQRVPNGYDYYTEFNNIPVQYRNQYNLDPNSRYIYRNDQIYVVDPRTNLVSQVLSALIR